MCGGRETKEPDPVRGAAGGAQGGCPHPAAFRQGSLKGSSRAAGGRKCGTSPPSRCARWDTSPFTGEAKRKKNPSVGFADSSP